MNGSLFRSWAELNNVSGQPLIEAYKFLSRLEDSKADELISAATIGKWPVEFLLGAVEKELQIPSQTVVRGKAMPMPGPKTKTVSQTFVFPDQEEAEPAFSIDAIVDAEEVKEDEEAPQKPMSKAERLRAKRQGKSRVQSGRERSSLLPSKKSSKDSEDTDGNEEEKDSKSNRIMTVAAVILFLAVLLFGGWYLFGDSGSSAYSIDGESFDYTEFENITPTSSPNEAVPGSSFRQETEDRWQQFMNINKKEGELNEPFLRKPTGFMDFFQNFPTRWVLWILFLWPIFSLLKQDRFAAKERTDINSSIWGLAIMFIFVLASGPLSALMTYVTNQFATTPTTVPEYVLVITGVLVNLVVQRNASMSGRRDYSALAIAGLFFTGAVIIWWFVPSIPVVVLGGIFMALGIWLQSKEMSRTHQSLKAHLTTLVMLIVFGTITMLIYFLVGLVPDITPDMAWIQQFLFAALYASRLFLGALIGMLVAFSVGDQLSTAIMPPQFANGTVFKGRPVVDHNERPLSRAPDDFDSTWDVNSRFDAMAYAIMLLYVITPIVWYIMMLI